jgi:hypothetical protein
MEKLGMAGRQRQLFVGLLTGALAVVSAGRLFSDDGAPEDDAQKPLEVSCEIERETLEVGRAFTVTLVVNHPIISEVLVIPPDFRDEFSVHDRRSFSRLVGETALKSERRSAFELTLVPLREGSLTLEPFAVLARNQCVWTPEISFSAEPSRAAALPSFRWEAPKTPLAIGEWSVFRLVVSDARGLRRETLKQLRFEPPPEAIAEHMALAFPSASNVPVIELRILPLRTGPFTVKPVDFETELNGETVTLRIPSLRVVIP